ncbi:hypothetical protein D3C75_1371170 [compost metagenome]
MQRIFRSNDVEQEIASIQKSINALLDLRFVTNNLARVTEIDDELRQHTRRLFVLEA